VKDRAKQSSSMRVSIWGLARLRNVCRERHMTGLKHDGRHCGILWRHARFGWKEEGKLPRKDDDEVQESR
jgi:hypothetical protein